MVLEAVMILVDNSESCRNGDYQPTRFEAQADAVNVIFQHVTQGNAESTVGLMSIGAKGPDVLATLTADQGKILDGLHRIRKNMGGTAQVAAAIKVAGLTLKHRLNKAQRPRMIVFVCSPVEEQESELVTLAKKMKKNNTAVDFVLFGDIDDANQQLLAAFNREVKGNEGSHLVVIPPSSKLLSDQLITTPILLGEDAGRGVGQEVAGSAADDFPYGIDPSVDPELALALRMSMEEEKARQEKKDKKAKAEKDAEGDKSGLETVDEGGESAPLLDKDGQPDGSKKEDEEKAKDADESMDIS